MIRGVTVYNYAYDSLLSPCLPYYLVRTSLLLILSRTNEILSRANEILSRAKLYRAHEIKKTHRVSFKKSCVSL